VQRLSSADKRRLRREVGWAALFPILAAILLAGCLFRGEALLPTRYLAAMEPWRSQSPASSAEVPPWNVLQWDGAAEFYPWRLQVVRSLRQGTVPLWNPHQALGLPLLANSQSAPLYPPHWLLALPGPGSLATRLGWLAWLHLALAGFFAFLLARQLGCRPAAAAVAGVAWQLAGFNTMWLSLPSFLEVSCWLPLLLYALNGAAATRRPGWIALIGLAMGMMVLAGHLQIALFGCLAAILWSVWLIAEAGRARRSWGETVRVGGALLAGGVLGLLLAAPQVLPALELSRHSHRATAITAAGYQAYVKLALPPWQWITLLAPDYFGMPLRGDFWGFWRYLAPNVMEYAGSVGVVGWLLAAVGLIGGFRVSRRTGALTLVALLGLLIASGSAVDRWLYFGLPGFAQSGSPGRALVLTCLGAAMLAGLGAEWLLRLAEAEGAPEIWWRRRDLRTWALAAVAAAVALLLTDRLTQASLPADILAAVSEGQRGATRTASLVVSWGLLAAAVLISPALARRSRASSSALLPALWIALIAAPQLAVARGNLLTAPREWVFPETSLIQELRDRPGRVAFLNKRWSLLETPPALMPPNLATVYGLEDVAGYDSLLPGHAKRFLDALAAAPSGSSPPENGNIAFVKRADSPLWPLTGAATVVRLREGRLEVERREAVLPPAYLVEDWQQATDREALRALRRWGAESVERLREAAYLPATGPEPPPRQAGTEGPLRGDARFERLSPTRNRVRYQADRRALLIVLDTWDAGWRATLRPDGGGAPIPLPVQRVNVNFEGVFVPAGAGEVEFVYAPASFRIGVFLGLLALLTLSALAAFDLGRAGVEGSTGEQVGHWREQS